MLEVNFIFIIDGVCNILFFVDFISMDIVGGVEVDYKEFVFLRAGVS